MRNFILPLVLFFLTQNASTQEVSKLTVPTSPAFSILDFEPTAVMRPTNAKSLAADVLSAFNKEGQLQMNLGLEVAPYWLKSHPKLKRGTYLRPNAWQSFLQSLSVSAATVKDTVSGDNKFGGGFRFRLYNGKPVDELESANNQLKSKTQVVSIMNGIKNTVGLIGADSLHADSLQTVMVRLEKALIKKNVDQATIDEIKLDAAAIMGNYSESESDIKAFLDQLIKNRVDAYAELAKQVSDLIYQRKGFIIEFAGATGFNASQGNDLERVGFWGNLSYNASPDDLFTLTGRYMFKEADSSFSNFDMGLGFLKKAPNYNISIEAMFRHYKAEIPDVDINNQPILRVVKDVTYRFAVQGSYTITKDISISLNLGKDFASPFVYGSGFFSILGFDYNLFSKEPPQLKQ